MGMLSAFQAIASGLLLSTKMIMAERECCHFLTFEFVAQPGMGPVIVRVTGPAGTKDFLKTVLWYTQCVNLAVVGQPELILRHGPHRYTPSILRIIRSAHWTALAINDSVLGLGRDSCRSSGFFRCRATKIAAAMAKTRFRPSSMWIMLAYSLFVRSSLKIAPCL